VAGVHVDPGPEHPTPVTPKILVQPDPFDTSAELAALTQGRTDIGGVGLFLGIVRGEHQGRAIVAMTLEHYPGMTERALAGITAEACARWPLQACTVIHRVGRLLPGEPIVLVATASAHRAASLESCAFLIDWLKTRAPFWKHEEFADGSQHWVEARPDDEDAASRWGATAAI
jgi:molybdopterin synthase catalytic subunit